MKVTVVFATTAGAFRRDVELPPGATIRQAIVASGLSESQPGLDLGATHKVGIFGRLASLEAALNEGDQVEIYRPLTRDPKESRRLRARGKLSEPRRRKD